MQSLKMYVQDNESNFRQDSFWNQLFNQSVYTLHIFQYWFSSRREQIRMW